ncbi:hypothetical protein CYMTET_43321 [Cymbomonas tetramitiformis]|uniref:Uncharacterized protein n=1 Tax=Cymbomonas tetramitiformis TaxID=36881 RepID=A0AAE0C2E4_9CHLO|nr:hypothetical protein CYMTET_43321 [Cymbomonas tetramitiformis]
MRKLGVPDDRCIGGRQSIELDLYNMRRKIVNAKSEVVTRLSSEVNHKRRDMTPRRVQSSRASRSLDEHSMREVRQMYQNVAEVDRRSRGKEGHSADAGMLSGSPQTYGLAKRMSYHRAAKRATGTTDFTAREHYKNVSNMYRRMEEQYSVTERKKNHLDYKLYPCYIRRRMTPEDPTVLTQKPVSNGYSEYTPREAFGFDTHNPSVSVASPGEIMISTA